MASNTPDSQTTALAVRDPKRTDKNELAISGSKEFVKYVAENGVGHVNEFIKGQLDAWKKMPIHVAVTGSSGAGKSSFINAMRELTADDPGAAAVNVVECTTELRHYVHPQNEQLKIWDLPGVGTQRFPRSSYLQKVKFKRYDFFVVVSCTRFTKDDLWLATEVGKLGKSFFFLHSKIDEDIENDEADNPSSHFPEAVMRKIRTDCLDQLTQGGITDPDVFLISNFHATKYDFPRMSEQFVQCLPNEKRDAWRMSMHALSASSVKEKRNILQSKVWLAATASAGAAAIPVPGVDIAVDLALLTGFQNYYIKHFRLDDRGLEDLAISTGKTVQELKSNIPQVTKLVTGGITTLVKQFAKSVTAEEVAKFVPIIGSVVAAGISFGVTYAVLNQILDTCEDEATKLLVFAIDEGSK